MCPKKNNELILQFNGSQAYKNKETNEPFIGVKTSSRLVPSYHHWNNMFLLIFCLYSCTLHSTISI